MKKTAKSYEAASVVAHVGGGELFKIDGNFAGASDRTLMLFDAAAVPADGAAPLWPLVIYAASPFSFIFDKPIAFKTGLVAVVSSNNNTLTAVAENMDIALNLDVSAERDAAETTVTDVSVGTLDVWANADNASDTKRLVSLEVVTAGNNVWAQIFGSDSPAAGDVPFTEFFVANADSRKFEFGRDGLHIHPFLDSDSGFKGCRVRLSSTPKIYTDNGDSAATITAQIKG
jgi:hypothetical protein